MESAVKIYIPIKKPDTKGETINNGATVGYPIPNPGNSQKK